MRHLAAWLVVVSACGRIGYDEVGTSFAPPIDAGPPTCPAATTEISAGSSVCIEQPQRGDATWTNAKADCEALGRRLCADAEWFSACVNATGLQAMTGDNYEWVAEEANGVAQKRGATDCNDMSAHEIFVDPYGYRCCVDR